MSPAKVVLTYVVFGGLWILLSDQIVAILTKTNPSATVFQSIKGAVFVFLSGSLIFVLLRYRESQLKKSEQKTEQKSQESRVLQRILRHNIRNDLNVIAGNVKLVDAEITDATLSDRLDTAEETVDELLQMAEKVQSIERINLDETVPESVDVVEIVQQANEQIRREHPAVVIEEDHPKTCIAQAGPSLRYAVDELLANSVEHYPGPEEKLRITTSITDGNDQVNIEIRDNGTGIPEEEIGPVKKGGETDLQHGSGIGLWLVQWVCDRYNGTVSFDSKAHDGALVRITLNKELPK